MSVLHAVLPLDQTDGFAQAFAAVVAKSGGLVCSTCGLERMGHGPESSWLGYAPHAWNGVPGDVEHARDLTSAAYRARCEQNRCGTYCRSTHATA